MYDNHFARPAAVRRTALVSALRAALVIGARRCGIRTAEAQDFESGSVVRKISELSEKLELTTNTSRILTLDKNIPRVQVNNPELLAVTPLSATQVQISAKKAGVTQVNLWDEDGNIHTVDVMIYGDARELRSRAADAVPAFLDQGLPLQRKPGAHGLRRSAGPRRPDHAAGRGLCPEGDQQHQRRRRAADSAQGEGDGNIAHEASQAGRRLGAFFQQRCGGRLERQRPDCSSCTSYSRRSATLMSKAVPSDQRAGNVPVRRRQRQTTHSSASSIALQQNRVAKILAEPNLVAVSGRPAQFNVGGEIPDLDSAKPGHHQRSSSSRSARRSISCRSCSATAISASKCGRGSAKSTDAAASG